MAPPTRSIASKLLLGVALPGLVVGVAVLALSWQLLEGVVSGRQDAVEGAFTLFKGGAAGVLVLALLPAAATLLAVHLLLTRRLRRLVEAMHRAEEGDFLVRVEESGADEVAQLGAAFNQMLARITHLRAEELEHHRTLEDAQAQLRLKASLEQRLTELSVLYEVARSLTATLELEELLARIVRLVHQRLAIPQFSIMLLGPEGRLEVKCAYPADQGTEGLSFALGEGACGRAALERKAVYLPDLHADRTVFARRHVSSEQESGSLLCVPMVHAQTLLGVLNFQRPAQNAFEEGELQLLTAVADLAATAVRNARLHEETVALSLTDSLTSLPNRRFLFNRLESELSRAARYHHTLAVLMLDIDHFKHLNDEVGHRAGDDTLREMAELLRSSLRKVDTVARYGGEEFMVVLGQTTKAEAVEVADKLRRLVEEHPFHHRAVQPGGRVTLSVGVAAFPEDASAEETLVDCADAALYASKRGGRNRVTAFASGMERDPGRERGPYARARVQSGGSGS